MQLSTHSHSIYDDAYVLKGSKKNLLGISELRQFALNEDNDVQRNDASGFDIQGNNDNVLKCNVTVDVGAASIYTNAVSACGAGTGNKKSNAVASTSDFTTTSDEG